MRRAPVPAPARARGIALLTVSVLVALAAWLVADLQYRHELHRLRAANALSHSILWANVAAAEFAAMRNLVARPRQADGGVIHFGQRWSAQTPYEMDFSPAEIVVNSITDLSGFLNLNRESRDEAGRERIAFALGEAEFPPQATDSILDFLDPDSERRPGGGEYGDYAHRGYYPPDGPISDLSELKNAIGYGERFDDGNLRALAAAAAVLPDIEAKINVNTASPAALRAAARFRGAQIFDEKPLVAARAVNPIAEFRVDDFGAGAPADLVDAWRESGGENLFSTDSRYFLVDLTFSLNDLQMRTQSVMRLGGNDRPQTVGRRIVE